jgi:hypothetical protein
LAKLWQFFWGEIVPSRIVGGVQNRRRPKKLKAPDSAVDGVTKSFFMQFKALALLTTTESVELTLDHLTPETVIQVWRRYKTTPIRFTVIRDIVRLAVKVNELVLSNVTVNSRVLRMVMYNNNANDGRYIRATEKFCDKETGNM